MLILLCIVLTAMVFSFCCSLMEACLLSLSRTDIAKLSEHRRISSEIWKRLKSDIQKPLAAILVINTLANTAGAAFSGAHFNKLYGNKWLFLFSLRRPDKYDYRIVLNCPKVHEIVLF